jgi:hypothetical protein
MAALRWKLCANRCFVGTLPVLKKITGTTLFLRGIIALADMRFATRADRRQVWLLWELGVRELDVQFVYVKLTEILWAKLASLLGWCSWLSLVPHTHKVTVWSSFQVHFRIRSSRRVLLRAFIPNPTRRFAWTTALRWKLCARRCVVGSASSLKRTTSFLRGTSLHSIASL